MDYLPYGKQSIDEDDIKAVTEVLRSDWLTTGPKVKEFETSLADRVGANYAVVFNSGTAALHAAYFAAGIEPNDEVITSPITFAATSNAALYLGARPVFADILPDTININPGEIAQKITSRTKVIAPVDFAGQPADLHSILNIAREHGLVVIEDAAHALGAVYHGKPVGSICDMTTFSFHPVKHITTGEGGAVTTNNSEYYKKLLSFRSHGMVKSNMTGIAQNVMKHLGFNYRMSDIQCALGISQLQKLDKFLSKRKILVDLYDENFKNINKIVTPFTPPNINPAWHLYVIRINSKNISRTGVMDKLHEAGIGSQIHYLPVYLHPYYRELGYSKGLCPQAEEYYSHALSLPLFPDMKIEDVRHITQNVLSILRD